MKTVTPPLFSVIIPTHNRAHLLTVAIKSVIQQRYPNWELLVIDDGSSDNTNMVVSSFAQKDKRIKYFFQQHQERSTARNKGIEEAHGEYICFLDDDDYYLDHHLLMFHEYLEKKNFPIVILRVGFLKKEGKTLSKTQVFEEERDINPVRFAAFNFCGVWSLCIPCKCLEQDSFPPRYRHWQDTHLILRLLAKYSFHQIRAYSYIYVIHPGMGSKTIYDYEDAYQRIDNNIAAMLDLFHRHGDRLTPYLPPNTCHFLVAEKYLGHANGALKKGKISLFFKLVQKSLKHDQLAGFWLAYLKLLLKFPFYILLAVVSFPRNAKS